MKCYPIAQILSIGLMTLMVSACSSNKLAVQSNDDVYFSDIKAHQADYATAALPSSNENGAYNSPNDSYGYGNNDYSGSYYGMNRGVYYNPYWGPTNFYDFYSPLYWNNGWSFSLGYNYYPSYYGYNYWNYGYSPYSGIYSYYNAYNSGYYGYYGYNHYNSGNLYYTTNPINYKVRPAGAYDNMRSTRPGGSSGIGTPTSRPIRPDVYSPSVPSRTVESTPRRNSYPSPTARPIRPTTSPRPTSVPNRQPESRPTRSERPYSPPPSSGSSGGGSSNGGSSGGGRPVRPGGH